MNGPELAAAGRQACLAAGFALGGAYLLKRQGIDLLRETATSLLRGSLQIAAMGLALGFLLRGGAFTSVPVMAGMALMAARIAAQRLKALPSRHSIAMISIAAGAFPGIGLALACGMISFRPAELLPVGSMILAAAMNAVSQSLNHFVPDLVRRKASIETRLSLGATAAQATADLASAAVRAGVLQQLNALASLGIVWIPGLMAGQILTGRPPLLSACLQFSAISLIAGATALSAFCAVTLARRRLFDVKEERFRN